jgi:uncharacterized membrane protein HdeD (DUF308 family)
VINPSDPHPQLIEKWKLFGTMGVSGLLMVAGIYVLVFSHAAPDIDCWAIGVIALVAGYWLK